MNAKWKLSQDSTCQMKVAKRNLWRRKSWWMSQPVIVKQQLRLSCNRNYQIESLWLSLNIVFSNWNKEKTFYPNRPAWKWFVSSASTLCSKLYKIQKISNVFYLGKQNDLFDVMKQNICFSFPRKKWNVRTNKKGYLANAWDSHFDEEQSGTRMWRIIIYLWLLMIFNEGAWK